MAQVNPSTDNAVYLTKEEVEHLLDPVKATEARVSITEKVASAYGDSQLSAREAMVAEQIFRLLVRDAELKVRTILAERLKDVADAPHDIIYTMARDVEEVALPVLKYSDVLTEADLISLIQATDTLSRHVAMSERKRVPQAAADLLLAGGRQEVAGALAANPGAELSEAALEAIVTTHGGSSMVMDALAERASLPPVVIEKMVAVVSDSLAATLKQKYQTAAVTVEKAASSVREGETVGLLREGMTDEEMKKLLDHLSVFNRLTPSLIVTALAQGHSRFFEMSLARMAGVAHESASRLIKDRGDLGFRAIYHQAKMPEGMYAAIKLLVEVMHGFEERKEAISTNRVVERLLGEAEGRDIDNLSYVIALVRHAKTER